VTDFLDEKRKEITDRLKELKPLVDEYQRLEAAASALAGVGGSASSASSAVATPRRRGPGRPRGSVNRTSAKAPETATPAATATATAPAKAGRKKPGRPPGRKKPGRPAGSSSSSSSSTPRRAGRRKGSGTRAAEALAFVTGQPGITIPELAAKMGIKQNYLYRVLPSLEQEGKVAKQGRGWHPKS
jgi:hypothetical protein